jgi:hypothetical protein
MNPWVSKKKPQRTGDDHLSRISPLPGANPNRHGFSALQPVPTHESSSKRELRVPTTSLMTSPVPLTSAISPATSPQAYLCSICFTKVLGSVYGRTFMPASLSTRVYTSGLPTETIATGIASSITTLTTFCEYLRASPTPATKFTANGNLVRCRTFGLDVECCVF